MSNATILRSSKRNSDERSFVERNRNRIGLICAAGLLTLGASSWAAHHNAGWDGKNPGSGGHHQSRGPIEIAEVKQRIDETFNTADVDGNGELSLAELATIKPQRAGHHPRRGFAKHHRRGMGPSDAQIEGSTDQSRGQRRDAHAEALFDVLDADSSGDLSREEFSPEKQRQARRDLHNQHRFAKLDSNGSNAIERNEFGRRLERLEAADTDADGLVTRQEMRAARAAHRQERADESS